MSNPLLLELLSVARLFLQKRATIGQLRKAVREAEKKEGEIKMEYVKIRQDPKVWGRHWNGGDYGFTQTYSRENPGEDFTVKYSTTSDIDFCPIYGAFQTCIDCRDYDKKKNGCTANTITIAEKELLARVKEAEKRGDYIDYIEME